jgi:hypothetical protein
MRLSLITRAVACAILSATLLAGCTHVKGVVLEEPSLRPSTTAVISVGRPTGIAVFDSHRVDAFGRFDFYLGPTDENNLYVYDGRSSPELTMRRIETYEISENMKLHLRPAGPSNPMLPADTNINP